MLQDGKKNLIKQIEEVRGVLNNLVCKKEKMGLDEQILRVSRQLDELIAIYMG
ncbi:aspartyl-phosphate phosphatase Spo0E family protein [Haloimpatiens lingqiaonensis]|uniref:aspartyl-phosphate phosphatase Spo0E family protein n=1 Tax=Haloimpatiens lingqiaonensis TaxID=1380675 RepID=UPI0010FD6EBC|nr:aspartyl-phosphate phosphatase Spo0E family protein [Haloimpatiens lingqiaonensis]